MKGIPAWEGRPDRTAPTAPFISQTLWFKNAVNLIDHSQTGVTLEAQTGNIFSQIPLLLVPEFPSFVI